MSNRKKKILIDLILVEGKNKKFAYFGSCIFMTGARKVKACNGKKQPRQLGWFSNFQHFTESRFTSVINHEIVFIPFSRNFSDFT